MDPNSEANAHANHFDKIEIRSAKSEGEAFFMTGSLPPNIRNTLNDSFTFFEVLTRAASFIHVASVGCRTTTNDS
eukprot:3109109-Pyramimonas_sp.AAC.1